MIVLPYGNRIASRQFITTLNEYLPKILKISNIDLIIMLALLLGIANAFVFVPSNTILQEKTSDEMRGKIYGVLNSVVGIFSFVPILAVGSFSDMLGVGRVLVGIGCSLLIIAIMKIFL
jgi:MFS family permease